MTLKKILEVGKNILEVYNTYLTILSLLITAIIPFLRKFFKNDYNYYWSLIICLVVIWGILFYFFRQKKKSSIQPQYSFYRFRYHVRYIVILSLVIFIGLFYFAKKLYTTSKDEGNKIMVLIIPFKNETDSAKDIFSTQLYGELNEQLDTDKSIKIELLEKPISDNEGGIKTANAIAKNKKAAILIWGWYAKSPTNIYLKAKFEILDSTLLMIKQDLKLPTKDNTFKIAQLNSFELQTEITNSNSFLILSCLGYLKFVQSKWNESIAYFDKALKFKSDDINISTISFFKGTSMWEVKENDSALFYFNQAIKYNRKYVPAYIGLGNAYGTKNQFGFAIKCYNDALYYDEDNLSAYNNKGVVYMITHQYDLAYENFMHAYEIYPGDTTTLTNIAKFYKLDSYMDKDVDNNQKKHNVTGLYHALESRAYYYFNSKLFKNCMDDVRTGIKLFPDSSVFYVLRADVEDDGENKKELSIKDYTYALKLNPKISQIYYERGVVYKKLGLLNQAMRDYNLAISIKPTSYEYNNKGSIYMTWKMYKKAYQEFNNAIKISPITDSSFYKEHLRMAEYYMKINK